MSSRRPFHRPAYAFNGWIMLLFLLLVALLVFSSYMSWANMPANPRAPYGHTSAYSTGFMIGIWLAPVIVPLIFLGISWLVGWGVYHMFGKSDDAGNVGASLVLLFAVALAGVNVYFVVNRPAPSAATANAPPASTLNPNNTADPGNAARQLSEQSQRQMQELAERGRQQAEAAREAARKGLEALRTGQPIPPAPPVPSASGSQPSTPIALPQANPAAQPVIDEFSKTLGGQIDALAALASKTLADLSRAPAHDVTRIKSRITDGETLHAAAEALKKSLDTASDSLTVTLEAAGLSASEARSAAFQWSGFDFHTATRGFAADTLIRICNKSKEECDFLIDNIGKWTLDSKGEVKAADFQIKSKAGSLRFFVKADADRKDSIIDQLRGK